MKRRFLTALVLFAMIASIFATDASFLKAQLDAAEPTPLTLTFSYNGVEIGREFNAFVKDGTVTIQCSDPTAQIYYTTSDVNSLAGIDLGPGPITSGPNTGQGIPVGTNTGIANRVFLRHAGGVVPSTTTGTLYTGPITIPERTEATRDAFTVSAVAIKGAEQARATQSFILIPKRSGANDRRTIWENNDYLIVSIYTDAKGLFDHKEGFIPPGLDREEWQNDYRRLNPTPLITGSRIHSAEYGAATRTRPDFIDYQLMQAYAPTLPANFVRRGRGTDGDNSAAERVAHVEVFGANGRRFVGQSAGLRAKGGWSRGTYAYEQRSLEFYARNSYGDNKFYSSSTLNEFSFPLFGIDHEIQDGGNLVHRYKRFRVRNGGSDRDGAYMRDELASLMARQSGINMPQNYRPGVVFLNGAYYGLTFLKSPRTENHIDRLYGGLEPNYHTHSNGERGSNTCFTTGCSRVIPGLKVAEGAMSEAQVQTNDNILGYGNGVYRAYRPEVCNGTSRKCSRADCLDYASEPNDMCGAVHQAKCTRRPGNCPANGCAAACSWGELRNLVLGDAAYGHPAIAGWSQNNPVGLTTQARWEEFKKRVDIENLFHYYSLNLFGANIDWPGNNVEMWRYWLSDAEKAEIAAGTSTLDPHLQDERWRFWPHDLEMGYSIWSLDGSPTMATSNNISALIARGGVEGAGGHYGAGISTTYMMRAVLGGGAIANPAQIEIVPFAQAESRARLGNAFVDIMSASHSPTNAAAAYNRVADAIVNEHQNYMLQLGGNGGNAIGINRRVAEIHRGSTINGGVVETAYVWPRWADGDRADGVSSERTRIQNFIRDRSGATGIPAHLSTTLGLTTKSVDVTVTVGSQGYAKMNTRPLGMKDLLPTSHKAAATVAQDPRIATTATTSYYAGAPIPIEAFPIDGYRTVWSGTGFTNPGPGVNRIEVTSSANVTINFERDPVFDSDTGLPRIDEVKSVAWNSDSDDYIKIYNPTTRAISTKGLYITDNNDENWKWQMPSLIIPANSEAFIKTDGNMVSNTLKRAQMNFNIGFAERLRLTDAQGKVLTRVEVSLMLTSQRQIRSGLDGRFYVRNVADGMIDYWPGSGFEASHTPPCETCGQINCDCPCLVCGFPRKTACICKCEHGNPVDDCLVCESPFSLTGGDGVAVLTSVVKNTTQQHWDGNKNVPIWEITATVTAYSDITNWVVSTRVGGGAILATNAPKGGGIEITGPWGQKPSRHYGANVSLTGGLLSGSGKNEGNQNTFHFIPEGTSITVVFSVAADDEPALSKP